MDRRTGTFQENPASQISLGDILSLLPWCSWGFPPAASQTKGQRDSHPTNPFPCSLPPQTEGPQPGQFCAMRLPIQARDTCLLPPGWVPTEPAPSLSLYRAQFCSKGLSLGVIPPTPRPLPLPDSQIFSSLVLWASHLFVFVVQGASGIPTPTPTPTEPSSPRKPRSSCLKRLPHEL